MESSVYLKDISCKMFDFLCNVRGSEEVVKARRLFFQIMEDVMSYSEITYIASCSKAEGLTIKGSDVDVMLVFNELPVYHCKTQIDSMFGLITDTENAAPGFVLLQHPPGYMQYPLFTYTYSIYGLIVPNDEFKQIILNGADIETKKVLRIHGPCISSIDNKADLALCLKSQTWPAVSMRWFQRPRYSTWPSSDDVGKISEEGLLYVPIGSKFGSKNENALEWRISFSVPEKILVHSFNQTQLMCYGLLKIVLKEVINTNSQLKNLLCSYFIKTVVFWLAEESDPSSWTPETLFTCFQSCLDRLLYWVGIGYCPNYFIPENNMFEGKIVGACQKTLLDFLRTLRKEGLKLVNRSATLSKFLSDDTARIIINNNDAEDIAIYPMLRYILPTSVPSLIMSSNNKLLQRICRNQVPGGKLTKSLYLLWLMMNFYNNAQTIPYSLHISNKRLYPSYKIILSHFLIQNNMNVVWGGALLAIFFYIHKEYEKTLSVTNYALQECTPDKYFVHRLSVLNFEGISNNISNISFVQRHKLSCIYICNILTAMPQSLFYIPDLTMEIMNYKSVDLSLVPPNILIHYLRFMCFHHLGIFGERNRCLRDIKLTLEEGFLIDNAILRFFGVFFFEKAARIANCLKDCEQEIMKACREVYMFGATCLFEADG